MGWPSCPNAWHTPPPKSLSKANLQRGNAHRVDRGNEGCWSRKYCLKCDRAFGTKWLTSWCSLSPSTTTDEQKICNFYPKRNEQQFPSLSGKSSLGESLKAMFPNKLIVKIETLQHFKFKSTAIDSILAFIKTWALFSKGPETFRARRKILKSKPPES